MLYFHVSKNYVACMKHRHLDSDVAYSSAAVDDVISRGSREDWFALDRAARADRTIVSRILGVCAAKVMDPYEQRYHFWKYHAEHALA